MNPSSAIWARNWVIFRAHPLAVVSLAAVWLPALMLWGAAVRLAALAAILRTVLRRLGRMGRSLVARRRAVPALAVCGRPVLELTGVAITVAVGGRHVVR